MVIKPKNKGIEFDKYGYLTDFDSWDFDLAKLIAVDESIDHLTDEHWRLIYYLRNYYDIHKDIPMIRQICINTGLCLKDIYRLFPTGPVKGLIRIAGLPLPVKCL